MSIWKRLKGLLIEESAPEPMPLMSPAPSDSRTAPSHPKSPDEEPAELLLAMSRGEAAFELGEALHAMDDLALAGRAALAIDAARRLTRTHPSAIIDLRVAELLSSRGDDEGADALLQRITESDPDAALGALMLAAEVAERRGDEERALRLYEQVIARELDFPRARARAERLRTKRPTEVVSGATIATSGALARGRWEIERELGRGGAGTVFAAKDLNVGRRVALKLYHRRGEGERERLLSEAKVAAHYQHPGVVRVLEVDPVLGAIAMEHVSGGSVRVASRDGLTLSRLARWVDTACDALELVHAGGYAHQDVKPSNFLLRDDDRVVLTDFGLASPLGERGAHVAAGEGTLKYMAPEQRSGDVASTAMDVHALGVTIGEWLELTTEAPKALHALMTRCCADEPSARPSLAELRAGFVIKD